MSNNTEKKSKEQWKNAIKEAVMLYPNERVAQFMGRKYAKEDNSGKTAIDIGFGSGRHIKVALDYGFDTYGIDYVQECVDIAKESLSHYPNLKELICDDIATYDFKGLKFDLILSFGVIFLRKTDEILQDLKSIHSLLKDDGKMLVSFRNKDATFYGKGEKIDENTFIINEKGYKDVLYTFFDKDECIEILNKAGFKVDYIEREDYYKNNLEEKHSWWIISAVKK